MEGTTPTDTTAVNALWRLIEGLSKASDGLSPTSGNGFDFGLKTLVVLLALLVVAIFCLGGAILYIFKRWEAGQAAGIKALSNSKDATKREITELLKSELGNSRAANLADAKEFKAILERYGSIINHIVLDLALIGQKLKMEMRSSPTNSGTKNPPQEGG